MTEHPKARTADLVLIQVSELVLVQDGAGSELARLDGLEAALLRLCTGERSVEALREAAARELGRSLDREGVFAALDRLADLGLVGSRAAPPAGGWAASRRRVLKDVAALGGMAGLGVALPAAAETPVSSLTPTAREAKQKRTADEETYKRTRQDAAVEQEKKHTGAEEATKRSRQDAAVEQEKKRAAQDHARAEEEARKKATRGESDIKRSDSARGEQSQKSEMTAREETKKRSAGEQAEKSPR